MSFQQQGPGYVDSFGNWISTGLAPQTLGGLGQATSFAYPPIQSDYRDQEIIRLRQELATKETALKECYCEIGRLHEQLRGLTAFDEWSKEKAKQEHRP